MSNYDADMWRAAQSQLDELNLVLAREMQKAVLGETETQVNREQTGGCGRLLFLTKRGEEAFSLKVYSFAESAAVDSVSGGVLREVDTVRAIGPTKAGVLRVFDTAGTMFCEHMPAIAAGDWRDVMLPFARDVVKATLDHEVTLTDKAQRIYDAFATKTAPPESVSCAVSCARCGHTNSYPLGKLDPKQAVCTHRLRVDRTRGKSGALVCCNEACGLAIPLEDFERMKIDPEARYSATGASLADEAQRLRDELRDVLADNARLRMKVERLERAKGVR